jgi:hypothetical protein
MSEQIEYTTDEYTMIELLNYPNPEGLHPSEIRWRNVARKLKQRLDSEWLRAEGLQSINSSLAAEVDRQRAVVEAAQVAVKRDVSTFTMRNLSDALDTYEAGREGADAESNC